MGLNILKIGFLDYGKPNILLILIYLELFRFILIINFLITSYILDDFSAILASLILLPIAGGESALG